MILRITKYILSSALFPLIKLIRCIFSKVIIVRTDFKGGVRLEVRPDPLTSNHPQNFRLSFTSSTF